MYLIENTAGWGLKRLDSSSSSAINVEVFSEPSGSAFLHSPLSMSWLNK
jgi:hypothetical protein